MLVLLIGGGLLIMARYLVFTDTNCRRCSASR